MLALNTGRVKRQAGVVTKAEQGGEQPRRASSRAGLVTVQGKRFVSGHAFRHADPARDLKPALAAGTREAPAAKAALSTTLSASLKRCPDTNLFFDCTTIAFPSEECALRFGI
jgi:hypothetical protein